MSLGNQNNPLSARMQGVRTARDGTSNPGGSGTPNTVTNVQMGELMFVGFNDSSGKPQVALYFKVGDLYYAPKDTVQWCASLAPMTDWIAAGVAEKVKDLAPVAVPKEDQVDVLGNDETPE